MVHPRVQSILAGIAASALGSVCLLLVLAFASLAEQDPWWRYPNLLGTTFYGAAALRTGPGLATISGAALQVVICGAVGAAFGALFGVRYRGGRLGLLGIVAGLVWWYLSGPFFARLNPLVPLYSETVPTMLAHVGFGACLGLTRSFLPRPPKRSAEPPNNAAALPPAHDAAPANAIENPEINDSEEHH